MHYTLHHTRCIELINFHKLYIREILGFTFFQKIQHLKIECCRIIYIFFKYNATHCYIRVQNIDSVIILLTDGFSHYFLIYSYFQLDRIYVWILCIVKICKGKSNNVLEPEIERLLTTFTV